MSFYGNVFYEFKNLFQKFKFINTGLNDERVGLDTINSTVNGTTATQNWDTLHIESGNRWIGLQSMDENSLHKGVTIFHRAPGIEGETHNSFTPVEKEGTVLNAEQSFDTMSIKVDNSGHVSAVDYATYKLPSAKGIVESGLDTQFSGGTHRSCFSADGEEEGVEDVILEPGQTIKALSLNVTEKGIISGFTSRNYKLPMSDTEKDYAEVTGRLDDVEKTASDLVENVPKTYATIETVGSISDLYQPNNEDENKFKSIAQSIGNLERSTEALDPELVGVLPVADQIRLVASIANSAEATALSYGLSIKYLESEIVRLQNEIDALKAQLNPTE